KYHFGVHPNGHVTSSATCSHEHSATLRISPLLMNGLRHAETRNDSPFMR
ncbi:mCG1028296, isoform CRA_b, partial [Mus musculus]